MSNDKGLLSGSITILIGAVIAIMALVRGPWQAWLLIGVFTLSLGTVGSFDPAAPLYAAGQTPPAAPAERTPAAR